MVADDRPSPVSDVPASIRPSNGDAVQSASFDVAPLRLELSALPGTVRLTVTDQTTRDIYVVDPSVLAAWSSALRNLLGLGAAESAGASADYRAPYLIDREGRASVSVEALVSERGVDYRLLVCGAEGRIAKLLTSSDTVRELAEAAAGAVAVARGA